MGSSRRPRIYNPLDLEILDRVFDAAWARVEVSPDYDLAWTEGQEALRRWIFALADGHPVDFDILIEKLDAVPVSWLKVMVREPLPATVR